MIRYFAGQIGSYLVAMSACGVSMAVLGCGVGSGISNTPQSAFNVLSASHISGSVRGGQQPINGAVVQLYEVGMSGYASAAKPILNTSVMTDLNGYFNITGHYNCDSGSYVYITASGGNPGLDAGTTNPNLTLAGALGSCSSLLANAATTTLNLNEVTTVAAAYALAQFSGGSTFGTALSAQGGVAGSVAPADNFATSATNVQGLVNAMGVAGVLANLAVGASPGNNINGSASPEWWQINTIANIISACVNSAGLASGESLASPTSYCGQLFANVNVPSGTNPATGLIYAPPADTLQAAVYLALNPTLTAAQISTLYNLSSPFAPFNPYVKSASAITDFSIAVSYSPKPQGATSPNLLADGTNVGPVWTAIDHYGNVWVEATGNNNTSTTLYQTNYTIELDPTGNPIPVGAACTAPCSNTNYEISSYTVAGVTKTYGTWSSNIGTPHTYPQITIDTNNNVWYADYTNTGIVKIPGSSSAGGVNSGNSATGVIAGTSSTSSVTAIAVDGANNVFFPYMNGGYTGDSCATTFSQHRAVVELVGGSFTNFFMMGDFNNNPSILAIDGGQTTTGSSYDISGGSAIPGSPFVWLMESNYNNSGPKITGDGTYAGLMAVFPTTGTNTTTACETVLSFPAGATSTSASPFGITIPGSDTITNATTTVTVTSATPTPPYQTTIPGKKSNQGTASASVQYLMNDVQDMVFDNNGNLYLANQGFLDYPNTSSGSITKFMPNYGSSFTPANFSADSTYTVFTPGAAPGNLGGITNTNQPRFLAVDGAGDIWFSLSAGGGVGALSSTGAALSPNATGGFVGSSCAACTYNGTTATYARTLANQPGKLSIDGSGNVWIPVGGPNYQAYPTTGTPAVVSLVGIATPVVTPNAVGLANHTMGTKP